MLLVNRNFGGRLYEPSSVIHETNKVISSVLTGDRQLPILKKIAAYVVKSGGKRIRPLFTYYLGKAYNLDGQELIRLGALLEIVHAASLLHDDVVDAAEERRSKPTGAKLFGNKQVVLGGDHLLSCGLQYLNTLSNGHYMAIFTDALKALSAAELLQMHHHFDLKTGLKVHAQIVDGKTAVLFRAAGALVTVMRGGKDFYASAESHLGLAFGRYFQERDDFLDYFDAARLKKKGLQDFTNGIVTAPLVYLLAAANKAEKKEITAEWEFARKQGGIRRQERIVALMQEYGIANRCVTQLETMQQQILHDLAALPEEKPREIIRKEFQKILAVRAA